MTAPRSGMQTIDGHVMATRMTFETTRRDTATEMFFRDLRAERIDPRVFTASALARQADLQKAKRCQADEPSCD